MLFLIIALLSIIYFLYLSLNSIITESNKNIIEDVTENNYKYTKIELEHLESEARYSQEAEDYYNNPENHVKC